MAHMLRDVTVICKMQHSIVTSGQLENGLGWEHLHLHALLAWSAVLPDVPGTPDHCLEAGKALLLPVQ